MLEAETRHIVKKSNYFTEYESKDPLASRRRKKVTIERNAVSELDIARHYQLEIFNKAKTANVIAVLNTGAGKTLIALLLLKHLQSTNPVGQGHKVSFFLVPTIPLVQQQSTYIEGNSNLRVLAFHGGMQYSGEDATNWKERCFENDVIVCTAAILLNALDHGYVSLNKVNLIIFDECHHARKEHAYNLIMSQHYATIDKIHRPKIFGMTASPIASSDSTTGSIKNLEKNLNAVAMTCDSHEALQKYVSRPTERIVFYDDGDFFPLPPLYVFINETCPQILPYIGREIGDCIAFCDLLGPWAADRALEFALGEILKNIKKEEFIRRKQKEFDDEKRKKADGEGDAANSNVEAEISIGNNEVVPNQENGGGDIIAEDENRDMDAEVGVNVAQPSNECEDDDDSDVIIIESRNRLTRPTFASLNKLAPSPHPTRHVLPKTSTEDIIHISSDESEEELQAENDLLLTSFNRQINEWPGAVDLKNDSIIENDNFYDIGYEEDEEETYEQQLQRLFNQSANVEFSAETAIVVAPFEPGESAEEGASNPSKRHANSDLAETVGILFKRLKKERGMFELVPQAELEAFKTFCSEIVDKTKDRKNIPPLDPKEIGAKVLCLINVLMEFKDDAEYFCGIVFCQQRIMARVLHMILDNYEDLSFIRSSYLLGHGAKSNSYRKSSSMSVREQNSVVGMFRTGKLNLLIATNVAEEGLDIKPCNCVIRFDMMDANLISYIQSRGRARHKNSQFIMIAQDGDTTAAAMLTYLKETEDKVNQILQEGTAEDQQEDDDNDEFREDEPYVVKSTGAKATMHNAIRIVQEYCSSLPRDTYFSPQPEYLVGQGPSGLVAEIHLPSCVRKECASIRGTFRSSVFNAKRDAAFRMIKLLHSLGEIDDNLKPPKKLTALTIVRGERQSKTKQKIIRSHVPGVPASFIGDWKDGSRVYVHVIQMKKTVGFKALNLGFLSFLPVNSFQEEQKILFDTEDRIIKVFRFPQRLYLTETSVEMIKKFHFEVCAAVLRSKFSETTNFATFLVPFRVELIQDLNEPDLDPYSFIDWEALKFCTEVDVNDKSMFKNGQADFDEISDYIMYDVPRYKRHFVILGLHPELNTKSNVEKTRDGTMGPVTVFYAKRFPKDFVFEETQYLIRARPLGYPYYPNQETEELAEVYLLPQISEVGRVQRRYLHDARKIPLLLRHLFHRALAEDIVMGRAFGDNSSFNCSVSLLQTALTTPSANVGVHYERLEFFGDSFLKIFLSLHLFVTNPFRQEGFLTISRRDLENNAYLRKKANELKLERYILSNPFSRTKTVPPTYDKQPIQLISDKTVADCVEASIGACFLHNGEASASSTAKLFISADCKSNFGLYYEHWKTHKITYPEVESLLLYSCGVVEHAIGYQFKNKAIIGQALSHSSSNCKLGSYERLEFLGDSVLGFMAAQFVYKLDPPLQPGPMSDLRSEMVHNQFLGAVASRLGFPKLLHHMSTDLGITITNWMTKFSRLLIETDQLIADGVEDLESDSLFFWNTLETCPKAIGDLYESVLGAVFLDSGFSLETVYKVFEKTLIEPWWHRFKQLIKGSEGLQVKHPVRIMADLVSNLRCTEFTLDFRQLACGRYSCEFKLHGVVIGDSISELRRDSKKAAAFKAVKFFDTQKEEIDKICNCAALAPEVEREVEHNRWKDRDSEDEQEEPEAIGEDAEQVLIEDGEQYPVEATDNPAENPVEGQEGVEEVTGAAEDVDAMQEELDNPEFDPGVE